MHAPRSRYARRPLVTLGMLTLRVRCPLQDAIASASDVDPSTPARSALPGRAGSGQVGGDRVLVVSGPCVKDGKSVSWMSSRPVPGGGSTGR
jgi:hypothetical protein